MPTSINGWEVLDQNGGWGDPRLRTGTIPGTSIHMTCRAEVWPLLASLAADYNTHISDLRIADAYDYRLANAGGGAWSDHSSGTALDINYDKEGAQGTGVLGWWRTAHRYVKAARLKKLYKVLMWGGPKADVWGFDLPANLQGWGGDYSQAQYLDAMHWAVAKGKTLADVQAQIKLLGIDSNGVRHNKANGKPIKRPAKK